MDDEEFLKINREITRCFVGLMFESEQDIHARSPEERERFIKRQKAEQTPDQISRQVIIQPIVQICLFFRV